MSRQYRNGTCSCWAQVDNKMADEGTELDLSFAIDGNMLVLTRKPCEKIP